MPWINEATVNAGDGNDSVIIYERGEESDTINLGAGDDSVRVVRTIHQIFWMVAMGQTLLASAGCGLMMVHLLVRTFALGSNATNFENIEGQ